MSTPTSLHDTVERLAQAGRFREAIAAFREAGDDPETGTPGLMLVVARAATRAGKLRLARRLAREALDQFQARADDDGVMHTHNLLGALDFEQGQLEGAAERFRHAQNAARRLGDFLMVARTANNLASVAHLSGRVDEARALYREALLSYQRIGHRRGTAETYHNLGLVAREDGDLPASLAASDQAVRHATQSGESDLRALALAGRAETGVALDEGPLALERLSRAAALAATAGDEIGAAEVERVRALAWWHEGDAERALAAAESARQAAERLGSALLRGECAALAAQALRTLGRSDEAATRQEEALHQFRAVGARRHLERLAQDSG